MPAASRLLPLLSALILTAPSCVRLTWSRTNIQEPIPDHALAAVAPDRADLTECLAQLGAPLLVWEYVDGGVALAYGWQDQADWSVTVSYSFTRFVSASFEYAQGWRNLEGIVVLLDRDLVVRQVRRGLLRDIASGLERRRPNDVDNEAQR